MDKKLLIILTFATTLALLFISCGPTTTETPELTRTAIISNSIEISPDNTITYTKYDDGYVVADLQFKDLAAKHSTAFVLWSVNKLLKVCPDFEVSGVFSGYDFKYIYNNGEPQLEGSKNNPEYYYFDSAEFSELMIAYYKDELEALNEAIDSLFE